MTESKGNQAGRTEIDEKEKARIIRRIREGELTWVEIARLHRIGTTRLHAIAAKAGISPPGHKRTPWTQMDQSVAKRTYPCAVCAGEIVRGEMHRYGHHHSRAHLACAVKADIDAGRIPPDSKVTPPEPRPLHPYRRQGHAEALECLAKRGAA